jgi:4-amino-4-deoxychorismate lyase
MAEIIYLNSRLIPRSKAKLSPFDYGFLYGYGLFETMRTYQGHIFRLDRHLTHLRHSAQSLGLRVSLLTQAKPAS